VIGDAQQPAGGRGCVLAHEDSYTMWRGSLFSRKQSESGEIILALR